jgi:hypothetical protein
MKTRVYAIDVPDNDLTDDEFMDLAEQQGRVWTLEGFEKAFNNDEVSDQWIIKIINLL